MQLNDGNDLPLFLFQSTPANTGGRCRAAVQQWEREGGFNPRPPILAGDAAELIGAGVAWPVSIHARQYWRAMPWNDPVPKFTNGERGRAMERPHGKQEPFERLLEARQS